MVVEEKGDRAAAVPPRTRPRGGAHAEIRSGQVEHTADSRPAGKGMCRKQGRKDTAAEIFNSIEAWREQAAVSNSPHTVEAYRNATDLYIRFLDQNQGITTKDFTWECFSREKIEKWMIWLTEGATNRRRSARPLGRFARRRTCGFRTSVNSSHTWRAGLLPHTDTSTMRRPGSRG